MWRTVEPSLLGECASNARPDSRSAPCARGKHSATLVDGYVYILGGRGGGGGSVPLKDFWRYCLATGRWERLSTSGSAPGSLQEHSVVAHGTKLYVFGGEASHGNEVPLWIYDTQIHQWRKVGGSVGRGGAGGAPSNRRGHSAHALPDCFLVYGGYKDLRGSTNELWAFHFELERWQLVRTAGAGPARHRHAAGAAGGRLYVHGGQHDLLDCGDLWYYHTVSRRWVQVRTGGRVSPSPRWGHAGVSAGGALYIYGGLAAGHPTNELWNFHYASETWHRMSIGLDWPSARVDAKILLVPGGSGVLKFRSKKEYDVNGSPPPRRPSSFLRRTGGLGSARRGAYSMLSADPDSTETLLRLDPDVPRSHSSYLLDDRSPPEGDVPNLTLDLSRGLISVPDFADLVLPTPVLSPVEAAKLVYLDSDEEEDMRKEREMLKKLEKEKKQRPISEIKSKETSTVVAIPKSASVRFSKETTIFHTDDEGELSTSDYASAEKVNRLSGMSGFSNPHYLGPDVRKLGVALTPDSGVGPTDIELQDFSDRRRQPEEKKELHILLVGGKEPPHLALLQRPLSLWSYRLL